MEETKQSPNEMVEILNNMIQESKATHKIDISKISDGYHTFEELYDSRMALTAALFNLLHDRTIARVVKSWKHNDGEPCFGGGWFIVQAMLPNKGQVSFHYPAETWQLFKIPAVEYADKWDGHGTQQAIDRLLTFI